MRVLITGSHGFIGSAVALHYAKDPTNKLTLIDNLSRHRHNLFLFEDLPNVDFWQVDLRDFNTLDMIIKSSKPDVVIHCCGQTAVTTSMVDPQEDFTTNVVGTFNLLESLRVNNLQPKFIFTSTNKVYGENVNNLMVNERETRYELKNTNSINELMNVDHTRHTPYGASKLCADLLIQEYAKSYGIDATIFRMSCIYGERQFGVEDQGWLAHFIFSILNEKEITIFGDGKQVRDVLYISDLVDLMAKVVSSEKKHDIVYNVGGGADNTISICESLNYLAELHNKELTIKYGDWRPSDQKVYISDISKVSSIFWWKPKVSVKEGIANLYDWVKDTLKP